MGKSERTVEQGRKASNVHANQPSSSSRRVGAGNGAPGFVSCVGSLTPPPLPKGLRDCSLPSSGELDDVFTGASSSRRLQPRAFIESRNELDAMAVSGCVYVSDGPSLRLLPAGV